jgi:hypothetical protein
MPLDPSDRPADHAAIHLPEEADELLGHIAAVIQQHDQQVVLQAADLPRAAGLGLAPLGGLPRRAKLRHHPVESRHAHAGQAAKTGAAAKPRKGQTVWHCGDPFPWKESYESYRAVTGESPVSSRHRAWERQLPQQV